MEFEDYNVRSSLALTPSLNQKLDSIGNKIRAEIQKQYNASTPVGKPTKTAPKVSDSRTLAALIEFFSNSEHLDDLVKAAVKLNQLDGRTKEGKAYRKKLIAAAEKKAEAEREAAAKKDKKKSSPKKKTIKNAMPKRSNQDDDASGWGT